MSAQDRITEFERERVVLRETVEAAREYLEAHWVPTGTAQGIAQARRLRAAFSALDAMDEESL